MKAIFLKTTNLYGPLVRKEELYMLVPARPDRTAFVLVLEGIFHRNFQNPLTLAAPSDREGNILGHEAIPDGSGMGLTSTEVLQQAGYTVIRHGATQK